MYIFILFVLSIIFVGFSYAVPSTAVQIQSLIDESVPPVEQKSSAKEYGRRLYEKARYYMKSKERFERNLSAVVALLEESGRQNHPPALKDFAYLYEHGKGVPKDMSQAVELYVQAVQLNYAPAMVSLAYLHEHGKGVPKDMGRAVELYVQAVQLNYAPAMTSLAHLHEHGKGVPKDMSRAVELYVQAVQLNYAPAITNLAYLYEHEEDVTQNLWKKKAVELLKQARKEEPSTSSVKAAALAYIYAYGIGLPVDYGSAKKWIDVVIDRRLSGLSSAHQEALLRLRTSIYSHLHLNFDSKYMPSKQYVLKFLNGPVRREALKIINSRNCKNTMRETY